MFYEREYAPEKAVEIAKKVLTSLGIDYQFHECTKFIMNLVHFQL